MQKGASLPLSFGTATLASFVLSLGMCGREAARAERAQALKKAFADGGFSWQRPEPLGHALAGAPASGALRPSLDMCRSDSGYVRCARRALTRLCGEGRWRKEVPPGPGFWGPRCLPASLLASGTQGAAPRGVSCDAGDLHLHFSGALPWSPGAGMRRAGRQLAAWRRGCRRAPVLRARARADAGGVPGGGRRGHAGAPAWRAVTPCTGCSCEGLGGSGRTMLVQCSGLAAARGCLLRPPGPGGGCGGRGRGGGGAALRSGGPGRGGVARRAARPAACRAVCLVCAAGGSRACNSVMKERLPGWSGAFSLRHRLP